MSSPIHTHITPKLVYKCVCNKGTNQNVNLTDPVRNFSSLAEALILVYWSNIAQTSKFTKAKRVPA